jgi:hypothetical protein
LPVQKNGKLKREILTSFNFYTSPQNKFTHNFCASLQNNFSNETKTLGSNCFGPNLTLRRDVAALEHSMHGKAPAAQTASARTR